MNDQTMQPMPAVRGGLNAYLQVDGALKAAAFYQRAFGAEQAFAYPPDEQGRTMHVHLYVNGSSLMLSDSYPEHGHPYEKPQGFSLQLHPGADEIDAWWQRAVDAGCEVVTPLQVMFWGDRWGQLRDPFGIIWGLNAPADQAQKGEGTMSYVDGFVLAIPKDKMDEYRKIASQAGEVWKEHGALAYVEAVADDVPHGELTSFPRAVQAKKDEVVVFAWILYESREQRDAINKKVMEDPRTNMDMSSMPFDTKRMIFGGFKSFVEM